MQLEVQPVFASRSRGTPGSCALMHQSLLPTHPLYVCVLLQVQG